MNTPAIELQAVNKQFGKTHAVRDLDLVVPAGSLCGFLGPNGAGKSTTIRMIMSIIYPDSGAITVLGGSALDSKDRIGYLPEERGVYRKMRVGEFLEYIGRLKGIDGGPLRSIVKSWLDRIELRDVYKKRCQELSKGMQQKVQFLAAVIHDPELLILDEPFSGLDPVNAALLNRLITEQHQAGKTIIFSTHVLHQAEQVCDRIFLINHGEKLLDAGMSEIREQFDPRTILAEPLHQGGNLAPVAGVRRILPAGSQLEIELDDDADPQSVMQDLMQATPLRSIELRRITLTEVFVRLVQRHEGRDAADAVRVEFTTGIGSE